MFSGDKKQEEDLSYAHTRGMLMALGLQARAEAVGSCISACLAKSKTSVSAAAPLLQDYENNFKKGLLNDATLPLLTDRRAPH